MRSVAAATVAGLATSGSARAAAAAEVAAATTVVLSSASAEVAEEKEALRGASDAALETALAVAASAA